MKCSTSLCNKLVLINCDSYILLYVSKITVTLGLVGVRTHSQSSIRVIYNGLIVLLSAIYRLTHKQAASIPLYILPTKLSTIGQ
jgi:hypothetical protein